MITVTTVVSLLGVLVALLGTAATYLRKVTMERPPVGAFTYGDVALMTVGVIALPLLYVRIAPVVVSTIFGLMLLFILHYTLSPVLGARWALAAGALLLAADVAASIGASGGAVEVAYLVLNNLVLGVAILGVCNLYVQAGMRAAHVTLFAVLLTGYDYVATALLPTTAELISRLAGMPFAPQLVVGLGQSRIGLGLGDSLMLTLWMLAAAKAFGRLAGWCAALLGLGSVCAIFGGFAIGLFAGPVPVMVLMGPLIALQYAFWRRQGPERSTYEWRHGHRQEQPSSGNQQQQLEQAVSWYLDSARGSATDNGHWAAFDGGEQLAAGETPGAARRQARQVDPSVVPVIIRTR